MDNVINLPARATVAPVAPVAPKPAPQDAWAKTPRGRLEAAIRGLIEVGYTHTADRVIRAYRSGFREGDFVNPAKIAEAMGEFASVPPNDGPAFHYARLGAVALVAIAFPLSDVPGAA